MAEEKKIDTIPTLEQNHCLLFNKQFNQTSVGEALTFIMVRNMMENRPKKIKMIINSYGGDLACTFALIDIMKSSKIPIHTYGLGNILSCGFITFIAGTKGKRFITKNTSILSHQYSWINLGKEHELLASVKEMGNISHRMMEHYKEHTGLSEKQIKKYLLPAEDVWLTAEEAVDLGVADEIVDLV